MADITGHVQVASVPERHEPFTRELDDGRVSEAVDRIGYRGFVGCEDRPAAATNAGLGRSRRSGAERSGDNGIAGLNDKIVPDPYLKNIFAGKHGMIVSSCLSEKRNGWCGRRCR